MLDSIQERVATIEARLEELKGFTSEMFSENEPGWNLICHHLPELKNILELYQHEGGFLGLKSYMNNPLGPANHAFLRL